MSIPTESLEVQENIVGLLSLNHIELYVYFSLRKGVALKMLLKALTVLTCVLSEDFIACQKLL